MGSSTSVADHGAVRTDGTPDAPRPDGPGTGARPDGHLATLCRAVEAAALAGGGPTAHLRDLLRSAVDAVRDRRAADPTHRGRIRVTSAGDDGPLVVRDDGVGSTAWELRELLASADGLAPLDLAAPPPPGAAARLLAAFLACDTVEVRTRSSRTPDAVTVAWVGHADGTGHVALADEPLDAPGTEVRLHPRPEARSRWSALRTREVVRDLLEHLDVPVDVDGIRVDALLPLWDRPADEQVDWFREHLGAEPLAVLPLGSPRTGVRALAAVHPTPVGPTGTSTTTTAAAARVDRVHARGVRVVDPTLEVLPRWSFCVTVAADVGAVAGWRPADAALALDAARTDLERSLLCGLLLLAGQRPEVAAEVVRDHGPALRARAAADPVVRDVARALGLDVPV